MAVFTEAEQREHLLIHKMRKSMDDPSWLRPAVTKMTPVLISGPGRSGTTLLMRMLSGSPDIAVAKTPPYEVRLLAYYAYVDRVLNNTGGNPTHPDFLARNDDMCGPNPYFRSPFAAVFRDRPDTLDDLVKSKIPSITGAAWKGCIEAYYASIAPGRPFFAEKNDNASGLVVAFTERLFGEVRQILTMRDPRDLFCSHRAYFNTTPEVAARDVTFACRNAMKVLSALPSDAVFVRYEDLVLDQDGVRQRVADCLGADIPPFDQSEGFSRHATSISRRASIGRWKTEMTQEERREYISQWSDAIAALGYEL